MGGGKISVLLAAYNGGRFIGEQISSILSELTDGDELIVSDDGSSDDTLKIVREFNDARIKIVQGPKRASCGILKTLSRIPETNSFFSAIRTTFG